MKVSSYIIPYRDYTYHRVYLGSRMQWIDFDVDGGYGNEIRLSFEDINEPLPRVPKIFPIGAIFHLQAQNEHVNIDSTSVQENDVVVFNLTALEVDVPYDTSPLYRVYVSYTDGTTRGLVKGQLRITV